jgi:small-conductance mechanosensitive channel
MGRRQGGWWGSLWVPVGFLVLVVLAGALNTRTGLPALLPKSLRDPFEAVVVLLVGASLSAILEGIAARRERNVMLGPHQAATIRFVIRLVLYVGVGIGVLAAFGVGVSSVVFGGAFLTVILGLAGQTLFGNLLGGIWLMFFHPFEVGDTIQMISSQYPILAATYPHEAVAAVHVGRVTDLTVMYTYLELESGIPLAIPNGVMVQAAVGNLSRGATRTVRVRLDVPSGVPLDGYREELSRRLQKVPGFHRDDLPRVWWADMANAGAQVIVVVPWVDSDDATRDRVLDTARVLAREMRPAAPETP